MGETKVFSLGDVTANKLFRLLQSISIFFRLEFVLFLHHFLELHPPPFSRLLYKTQHSSFGFEKKYLDIGFCSIKSNFRGDMSPIEGEGRAPSPLPRGLGGQSLEDIAPQNLSFFTPSLILYSADTSKLFLMSQVIRKY